MAICDYLLNFQTFQMIMRSWLLFLCLFVSPAWAAPASYLDQVQRMYVAYYGRPADPGGLSYWADRLDQSDGNLEEIIDEFGNSGEFRIRFWQLDTEGLIQNLYQQLFGRDVEEAGLTAYTEMLTSGERTLLSLALDIANGASGDSIDGAVLSNRVSVAHQFTQAIVDRELIYDGTHIDVARDLLSGVSEDSVTVDASEADIAEIFDFELAVMEPEPAEDFLGLWQVTETRDLSDCGLDDTSNNYELSIIRRGDGLILSTGKSEFAASFDENLFSWTGQWVEAEEEQDIEFSLVNASASVASSDFSGKFSFGRDDGETQCQGTGLIKGSFIASRVDRPVSLFELTLSQLASSGAGDPFAEGNLVVPFAVETGGSFIFKVLSEQDSYLYLLNEYGAVIAEDDDSGGGFEPYISADLEEGIYYLSGTTFLQDVTASLTFKAIASGGSAFAADDLSEGGLSIGDCGLPSQLIPNNLLWSGLDTCSRSAEELLVNYSDGGSFEIEPAVEETDPVGEASACVVSDSDLRLFSDDRNSRYIENICEEKIHVRWCFTGENCGDNDYYAYRHTLKAGEKYYSFAELPLEGNLEQGACYGGRSAFEELDELGSYRCL